MKIFHLSDLHIGKSVNGFSMIEDQQYILSEILSAVDLHQPDAVVIAGDVYDKTVPSGTAVSVFDAFLTSLSRKNTAVFCISGNHDSPERLSFASRIMENTNIYIAGVLEDTVQQVSLQDEYGAVNFHLLPFIRPANVRPLYPGTAIESYADAVQTILAHNPISAEERNILVAHQFVLPLQGEIERSDSETEPVGGVNGIPSALFDSYDYVALGHLHGPQKIGRDCVRYSGSPLKYSFSETAHNKSISVVDLGPKNQCALSAIPLTPLRDMRKIRGPFADLTAKEVVLAGNPDDYLHITLTDEEEIVDAIGKLKRHYPHVMELAFDNKKTRHDANLSAIRDFEQKSPLELFQSFYEQQNGVALTENQREIAAGLLKDMEGRV